MSPVKFTLNAANSVYPSTGVTVLADSDKMILRLVKQNGPTPIVSVDMYTSTNTASRLTIYEAEIGTPVKVIAGRSLIFSIVPLHGAVNYDFEAILNISPIQIKSIILYNNQTTFVH